MSHSNKNDFTIEIPKFDTKAEADDYGKKITAILAQLGHGHLELIANPEWVECRDWEKYITNRSFILICQPTGEGLYIGDRKLNLNLDSVIKAISE